MFWNQHDVILRFKLHLGSGHLIQNRLLAFWAHYLGEFRLDFIQNGGMDTAGGILSKNQTISGLSDNTEIKLKTLYLGHL